MGICPNVPNVVCTSQRAAEVKRNAHLLNTLDILLADCFGDLRAAFNLPLVMNVGNEGIVLSIDPAWFNLAWFPRLHAILGPVCLLAGIIMPARDTHGVIATPLLLPRNEKAWPR
jgi:hypothetical protein